MKYLNDKNYEEYMFDIIYSVASQTPIELDLYLSMFDTDSFLSSYKVDKILGTVGKSLKVRHSHLIRNKVERRFDFCSHFRERLSCALPY